MNIQQITNLNSLLPGDTVLTESRHGKDKKLRIVDNFYLGDDAMYLHFKDGSRINLKLFEEGSSLTKEIWLVR